MFGVSEQRGHLQHSAQLALVSSLLVSLLVVVARRPFVHPPLFLSLFAITVPVCVFVSSSSPFVSGNQRFLPSIFPPLSHSLPRRSLSSFVTRCLLSYSNLSLLLPRHIFFLPLQIQLSLLFFSRPALFLPIRFSAPVSLAPVSYFGERIVCCE